ncbi:cytochrome c3 family protein [Deltaproteobacteria bacterium TL4]
MKGKKIKVEILLGVALLLIFVGSGATMMRPEIEPDTILASRFGEVSWNHEQHARMKDIANCTVCHHTEKQGNMNPKPCKHCHKLSTNQDSLIAPELFMKVEKKEYGEENGPPVMTALHGRCMGCHKVMNKGPMGCRDCHKQSFSGSQGLVTWDHSTHAKKIVMNAETGLEGNCVHCHHQDKKAVTDADYRSCRDCHKPADVMGLEAATEIKFRDKSKIDPAKLTGIKFHAEAKHGECETCHVAFNFEDDSVPCQECHKGWVVDTKVKRPTLEQAIHQRCSECHNKEYPQLANRNYPGYENLMPVYCKDCHKADPSWISVSAKVNILWDHKKHGEFGDSKTTCTTCHHTDVKDAPHMACKKCHGTGLFDNPSVAEALDKRCMGCHKEQKSGLTQFESVKTEKASLRMLKFEAEEGTLWWNHQAHAIGYSLSCRNCHHSTINKEGVYPTAEKVKGVWPAEAGYLQSCRNCHGDAGPVLNSAAQDTKAPILRDVFKKLCITCHQKLGGGPQTWKDYFTIEPVENSKLTVIKR